jgi:hypothetical protein
MRFNLGCQNETGFLGFGNTQQFFRAFSGQVPFGAVFARDV